jgi:predicted amidohydrolase
MRKVTLASAQLKVEHSKTDNLKKCLDFMGEAASRGADVLVFPELFLQGYADFAFGLGARESADQKRYYFAEAEPIPGPSTDRVAEAARRYGTHAVVGLAERGLNGNIIFNSAALIGPDGVIGVYRKIHNQFEFPFFSPGRRAPVFDLPFGRVSCLICYDLAFPELMRLYALKGADVALMPNAWPMKGHDRDHDYHGWAMDLAAQANAFFNQMWLVISNHCEKGAYSQGIDYYGSSQIVDPKGKVVEILGDEEGLILHEADLEEEMLASRTEAFFGLNLLQDRRPELYGPIADTSEYEGRQAVVGRWEDATVSAASTDTEAIEVGSTGVRQDGHA